MNTYLWQSQHSGTKHREISRFMHLSSQQLEYLPLSEMAFLFQWMFEQQNLITNQVNVNITGGCFDLDLTNKSQNNRREYARFYKRPPFAAVYNIAEDLRGQKISLIHLFTLETFGQNDQKEQNQSPLALSLKGKTDIGRLLQEAQEMYRSQLNHQKGTAWPVRARLRYEILKLRSMIMNLFSTTPRSR